MEKEKKVAMGLDIVQIILCFIAVFVFSIIFRLDKSIIRYLFLVGDFYVIYSGYQTLSSLENKNQKRIVKNAKHKIDTRYEKKLSI